MFRALLFLPVALGGLLPGTAGADGAPAATAGVVAAAGEAPACEAPQPGFLSVATTPWTAVVVDGTRVGTTPLFRLPLAPGAHRVEFVNDNAGVAAHEDVEVGEGELRKLKLVFLTAAEREAALDESRAEAARGDDDCLATDVDHAFLSVDVKPWARVVVDGRPVGSTPLFRHRVSLGPHRVLLIGPGGERTSARFDATADETVKLSLSFDATAGAAPATPPPPPPPTTTTDTPAFLPDQLR